MKNSSEQFQLWNFLHMDAGKAQTNKGEYYDLRKNSSFVLRLNFLNMQILIASTSKFC